MLTDRQQQILSVIRERRSLTGMSPTVREIGQAVGLSSSGSVARYIADLEQLGELERDPNIPRSLRTTGRMDRYSECDGPLTIRGNYCPHCGVQL